MADLNKSCYVLLGLLSKSACSGYQIKAHLRRVSDFFWSESNAQIYPNLKKLEALQLVTSSIDIQSGARQKRIYTISEKGMDTLKRWLHQDCEVAVVREDLLLQLSLGQHLTHPEIYEKITIYRKSIIEKLSASEKIIRHFHKEHVNLPDYHYLLLGFDHIQCMLNAKLAWCDKVLLKFTSTKSIY